MNMADSANAMTITAMAYTSSAATSTDTAEVSESESGEEPPTYPIHNPYMTSCGHVYCYYCISERIMRAAEDRSGIGQGGTQWECLRCGDGVTSADRIEAEAEGPDYESGVDEDEDDLEYGSEDMEFTDMSGSVGSYSLSGMSE